MTIFERNEDLVTDRGAVRPRAGRGSFLPFGRSSAFALALLAALAVACGSEDAVDGRLVDDAGRGDASGSSSDPLDAGQVDAGPSDARVPDAAPDALDVVCEQVPCYTAVSGNGGRHLCGLRVDGTVDCWGRDSMPPANSTDDAGDGALGRGGPVSREEGATAAPVVGLSNVTQISVGPNLGTCARTADGAVYCWGRNEFGQLGRAPSEAQIPVPTRVEGLPPIDEVHLGYRTACAVSSSERAVFCWGETMTRLGIDAGASTSLPQRVTTFRPPLKALRVGTWTDRDTIVALEDDGVLSSAGEVPLSETSADLFPDLPRRLPGVAQGFAFAYVSASGELSRWWGASDPMTALPVSARDTPYLPIGSRIADAKSSAANQLAPPDPWGNPAQRVGQGGVVLTTGRLFRWGHNVAGTLGLPPEDLALTRQPIEVLQVRGRVVSFATAFGTTCASLVSGAIECWGSNASGELGRGTVDVLAHPEAEAIR